jgi:hypothetical protein
MYLNSSPLSRIFLIMVGASHYGLRSNKVETGYAIVWEGIRKSYNGTGFAQARDGKYMPLSPVKLTLHTNHAPP